VPALRAQKLRQQFITARENRTAGATNRRPLMGFCEHRIGIIFAPLAPQWLAIMCRCAYAPGQISASSDRPPKAGCAGHIASAISSDRIERHIHGGQHIGIPPNCSQQHHAVGPGNIDIAPLQRARSVHRTKPSRVLHQHQNIPGADILGLIGQQRGNFIGNLAGQSTAPLA
jgi:hypothetical protein